MNQLIRKYRNKDLYSLNCAEAILYASNEYYNLNLSSDALKMVTGFGGGLREEHLCGIISGAVAVLSILFKDKTLGEESLLNIALSEFKQTFRNKYESIDCCYLKEHHTDVDEGCNYIIYEAAEMLQQTIDKYLKK